MHRKLLRRDESTEVDCSENYILIFLNEFNSGLCQCISYQEVAFRVSEPVVSMADIRRQFFGAGKVCGFYEDGIPDPPGTLSLCFSEISH